MCNRTRHPILLRSLSLGALLCMSACVLRLLPRVCEGLKSTRVAVGWGVARCTVWAYGQDRVWLFSKTPYLECSEHIKVTPRSMYVLQALKSIEYLEEEDAQKPAEEAVPGSPGSSRSRWDEEPSQLEELADFMGQVWALSLLGFYFSFSLCLDISSM